MKKAMGSSGWSQGAVGAILLLLGSLTLMPRGEAATTVARGPEAACKLSYQALSAHMTKNTPSASLAADKCYAVVDTLYKSAPLPSADCVKASRSVLKDELGALARNFSLGFDTNGNLKDSYWELLRARARSQANVCAISYMNSLNTTITAKK